MRESAEKYYAELRRAYDRTIRQLVPRYDDMAQVIIGLLTSVFPRSLLDIGPGPGSFTRRILEEIPGVKITAVEASFQMAEEAALALVPFGARAQVICQDVTEYAPEEQFDGVITNLALHNIPYDQKPVLLKKIRGVLRPGCLFLWGDLIQYRDPQVQAHYVERRIRHALDSGCAPELVEWNFKKEGEDDYPLTTSETRERLEEAGFSRIEIVWAHDTFAVFHARA